MLETLRDYAAEKLAGSDEAAEIRRRHAQHYAALPERAAPELTGPRQDAWLGLLATEDDNLRAALAWCLQDPKSHELGLRVGADLVLFWYLRSRHREGWRWLEPLLDRSHSTDSPARAAALWGAGFFLTVITDQRADDFLQQALDMARRIGDHGMIAGSLQRDRASRLLRERPAPARRHDWRRASRRRASRRTTGAWPTLWALSARSIRSSAASSRVAPRVSKA